VDNVLKRDQEEQLSIIVHHDLFIQQEALLPKKRRTNKFDTFMTKEELLYTITHELPARFLEGVIKIVHPAFDPATATDEDLEFDINLLDDDILYKLMKYVHSAIEGEEAPGSTAAVSRRTKDQRPRNAAKNAPKEKLRKEAPKKRRPQQRQPSTHHRKGRKPSTFIAVGHKKAPKMREIFKCEEVIHVSKTHDTEDEEVDILGI